MAERSRPAPLFGALSAAASGCGDIIAGFWARLDQDNISVIAAGVAFYGLLAIFPAMSALISIYGLVADPAVIERQVAALSGVLPQEALTLFSDQLHSLIAAPPVRLGVGLIVSLFLALWSATSASGALMRALTVAYEETERRGVIAFYGRALALTIAIGTFGLVSLFLIAVVPAAVDLLPVPAAWRDAFALIRWPMLAGSVLIALGFLYRFAPARQTPRWYWLDPGTIAAALLWLIGSAGFSFYVQRFASYNKTYGSLGAVVVLLMWFYLSAYIVLAGAELNSAVGKVRRR
jgi:membrane protein